MKTNLSTTAREVAILTDGHDTSIETLLAARLEAAVALSLFGVSGAPEPAVDFVVQAAGKAGISISRFRELVSEYYCATGDAQNWWIGHPEIRAIDFWFNGYLGSVTLTRDSIELKWGACTLEDYCVVAIHNPLSYKWKQAEACWLDLYSKKDNRSLTTICTVSDLNVNPAFGAGAEDNF